MKKTKNVLAFLLSAAMMASLVSCGDTTTTTAASTTAAATTAAVSEAAATPAETTASPETTGAAAGAVTLTDQAGREVTVGDVKSIAICWYMANDFVLALGAADRLVAIGPHDDFQNLVSPELETMDTVGRGRPDMEKLASLNPDLFVHTASDKENLQACEELGIPALAIAPETAEETLDAFRLVGKALGLEDRAEMLCNYYNQVMAIAKDKLAGVKTEDMPTFVLLGSEMGAVGTKSMMQTQMISAGGGVNVADGVESEELWPVVGTEQVFEWNPDYIFVSSTAEYTVEDVLNDAAWSDLTAVKEGHVYAVPSELHSWENLGLAPCLGTVWSMMKMHPDLYTEEELNTLVKEFYSTVYNLDVDRETLKY